MLRWIVAAQLCAFLLVGAAGHAAVPDPKVTVTKADGGFAQVFLTSGLKLNENSSLAREWIAVHQAALPVDLVKTPGIQIHHRSFNPNTPPDFWYHADYELDVKEPLAAVEVRFILFNVWGDRTVNLAAAEVRDLPAGTVRFEQDWLLTSVPEASQYYASIAYISKARTKAGRVIISDPTPVLAEARKFSQQLRAEDLAPDPRPTRRDKT